MPDSAFTNTVTVPLHILVFEYTVLTFLHSATGKQTKRVTNHTRTLVSSTRQSTRLQLLATAQTMQLASTAKWLTNLPTWRQQDISCHTTAFSWKSVGLHHMSQRDPAFETEMFQAFWNFLVSDEHCTVFSCAMLYSRGSIDICTWMLISVYINKLTPWSSDLPEKLTVPQLVKNFPKFYGNWRFITAFTSARHLYLSWATAV